MSVSETTVLVAAPAEAVWDFIGNADNWPVFAPGIEKAIQVKGDRFQTGAVIEIHGHLLTAPVSFTVEAIAAERPTVASIRSTVGTFQFTATCTIVVTPYGSATTMRVEIEPEFGGLFAGLADAVSALAYRTLLQSKMMTVADVIDGGSRSSLTKLQRKVLRLLQQGRSDREIADQLNLSPRVVGQHVDSILKAFKISARDALAQHGPDDPGKIAETSNL